MLYLVALCTCINVMEELNISCIIIVNEFPLFDIKSIPVKDYIQRHQRPKQKQHSRGIESLN